jgi:hypothetical protein
MSEEVKTTRITIIVEHDGQRYEKTMRALDSSFEAGDLAEWVRFTGKFMANEVSRKVARHPYDPRSLSDNIRASVEYAKKVYANLPSDHPGPGRYADAGRLPPITH